MEEMSVSDVVANPVLAEVIRSGFVESRHRGTIVALAADDMQGQGKLAVRSAGWYQKDRPTFSDALAAVRRQLWTKAAFSISPSSTEGEKVPLAIFNRLADLTCYAA